MTDEALRLAVVLGILLSGFFGGWLLVRHWTRKIDHDAQQRAGSGDDA